MDLQGARRHARVGAAAGLLVLFRKNAQNPEYDNARKGVTLVLAVMVWFLFIVGHVLDRRQGESGHEHRNYSFGNGPDHGYRSGVGGVGPQFKVFATTFSIAGNQNANLMTGLAETAA